MERLRRWCRRNPQLAGLLTALVITFVAGFGGVVWQWQRAEATARDTDRQRRRTEVQAVGPCPRAHAERGHEGI